MHLPLDINTNLCFIIGVNSNITNVGERWNNVEYIDTTLSKDVWVYY